MNGINANTKYIYECMHKYVAHLVCTLSLWILLHWILRFIFDYIPLSSREIYSNLRINRITSRKRHMTTVINRDTKKKAQPYRYLLFTYVYTCMLACLHDF